MFSRRGLFSKKNKQKNVHGLGFEPFPSKNTVVLVGLCNCVEKRLTKESDRRSATKSAEKEEEEEERKERSDGGRNVVRGILRVRGIESNLDQKINRVRERTKIGRSAITCKQTGEIIPLVNFSNLREELAEILGPHLVDWEDEGKRERRFETVNRGRERI